MAPTKTIGALLALLVVASGAAAAMPGGAPVDPGAQDDNETETADAERGPPTDAGDDANASEDESAAPAAAAGERGPPTDMPAPVPDFVGEIHQTIGDYLDGSVENLGAALADITPGDEGDAGEADENATATQESSPDGTPA